MGFLPFTRFFLFLFPFFLFFFFFHSFPATDEEEKIAGERRRILSTQIFPSERKCEYFRPRIGDIFFRLFDGIHLD